MKRKLELFMGLFMVFVIALATNQMTRQASAGTLKAGEYVIVLDAGHGGMDPGKVGINNALEKDINLAIAKKLKPLLEADGAVVIMTRTEDVGLYQVTSGNKKREDMKNRCKLVAEAGADLVISIHQNSYPEEYVKGRRCFIIRIPRKENSWQSSCRKSLEARVRQKAMTVIIFCYIRRVRLLLRSVVSLVTGKKRRNLSLRSIRRRWRRQSRQELQSTGNRDILIN